ncbi:hypothetical protein V5O48_007716 [Marasmius crinis-equi]|uniref:Flavin reductase like domain-containing protein n=1 Tax=Marasmius crinis-equi TaxID=585013 RepID=A0ABR3FFW2_9AGAR
MASSGYPEANLPSFNHDASFVRTEPPNPGYKFGDRVDATPEGRKWLEGEKEGWKTIDLSKETARDIYALMLTGVYPRPVAFVSSVSETGVENIAPFRGFSYFNSVTANPPTISISANIGTDGEKDTSRNIKATKGFTVNIISEPWIQQANAACINCPKDVSEWAITGLTKAPSIHVKAPRVRESAFSMECELQQVVEIAPEDKPDVPSTYLILGTVRYVHIRKDVLNERNVADPDKLKAIARMGDISYTRITEAFRLPRFDWKKEADGVQHLLNTSNM